VSPWAQELAREWAWLCVVAFCVFLYLLASDDDRPT
jgi:hypothetical protein